MQAWPCAKFVKDHNKMTKKRFHINNACILEEDRARVPIGGQNVLLQISLRIKTFDLF